MDTTYQQLWVRIQERLHAHRVYFEISALKFQNHGVAVSLIRTDPEDVISAIKAVLKDNGADYRLTVPRSTAGTLSFVVEEVSIEPKGIPFSSEDEFKGAEPVEIAIQLVRQKAAELNAHAADYDTRAENFTVYPVWFAYTLGNWKAMLSTSIPDGRYYEVTDNKEKGETYVDVYAKTSNTVHKHNN